jgi:hypothetical protein
MVSGQVKMNDVEGRSVTMPSCQFERVDNRWQVKR